ncbi:MAG: hypothetical protein DSM106950_28325 [Stigonema ocellatum SAG 48.90 = DSM 106950]|nr:hypothetical protein [Stigonema ocellatum SAG 48.90 = DSM 106950]
MGLTDLLESSKSFPTPYSPFPTPHSLLPAFSRHFCVDRLLRWVMIVVIVYLRQPS